MILYLSNFMSSSVLALSDGALSNVIEFVALRRKKCKKK